MAYITAPDFALRSVNWSLDRPAQNNMSSWTGKRTVVANPWHGKWRARVELATVQGEDKVRSLRSFLARCKGQVNTFRLYATAGAQNSNKDVLSASAAAQGATSMTISGADTTLLDGQMVTVNGQLLVLTADQSGSTITFEPPLRKAVSAGTTVVTSRPYALVYMANSQQGYSIEPWRLFGSSFEVEEAILEPDGTPPEGDNLLTDFKAALYSRDGVGYALSALPGYSFTRNGQQGAIDAAGAVQWFAANTPAINSAGFHVYGAATNTLRESQTFDSATWTKQNSTVTANALAAPDGTTTADLIVENTATGPHGVDAAVSPSPPVSTVLTISTIVKYAGRQWLWIAPFGPAGGTTNYAWFDIQNGVVGNRGSTTVSSSITPLANGFYRCAVVITTTATAGALNVGLRGQTANGATADYAGSGGNAFYLWQAQCLDGNYPNGGPLIATTAAAVTLGASNLEVGAALPNGDFIAWAVFNQSRLATRSAFSFSTAGAGSANERLLARAQGGTALEFQPVAGGAAQPGPTNISNAFAAGRNVILIGRRNGKYISAARHPNGTITIRDDASGTGAVPAITALDIGSNAGGAEQVNGAVEFTAQKNGTFTDAEITAILQGA